MQADVILPAAGTSERMNLPLAKQFLTVLGKHILAYTIDNFYRFPWIRHIVVVVSADQVEFTKQLLKNYGFTRTVVCAGSHTRHRSIFCGLQALQSECSAIDVVIIHDAARPFVPEQLAKEVTKTALVYGAAGVTRPLVSTVIRADDDARLVESLDRRFYTNSEMPQAFHYSVITSAYQQCSEDDLDHGTECLLLAMKYSQCRAALVKGTDDLWKVTYQKDIYSMESIVKEKFMVVSIIDNGFQLLALREFRSKLLHQQVKVAESTDVPANTFVILCDLQMRTDIPILNDDIAQICASYNLDMPSSAVRLDLMVVVVFLHSFSQTDFRRRIFDSSFSPMPSKLWMNVDGPSTRASGMNDSLTMDKKTDTTQSTQPVQPPDHIPRVSFNDSTIATANISASDISYPPSEFQITNTELPSVPPYQHKEFENLKHSIASLQPSGSGSYELLFENSIAHKCLFGYQTVVQMVKENVQSEIGGKFALVVGVTCRPESAISEQLVQLVWQRSLYTDGQILSF